MIVNVIGKQKTKYGYTAYCVQADKQEKQKHEGKKCFTCYCKFEPVITKAYSMRYYEKTGKYYIFE